MKCSLPEYEKIFAFYKFDRGLNNQDILGTCKTQQENEEPHFKNGED